jgi:hypothetical protein
MHRLKQVTGHVSLGQQQPGGGGHSLPAAAADISIAQRRRRSAATLARLGFAPPAGLDARHAAELREQGWTVVRGVIDERWLGELRSQCDRVIAAEGRMAGMDMAPEEARARVRAGTDPPPNAGSRNLLDCPAQWEVERALSVYYSSQLNRLYMVLLYGSAQGA